MVEISIGYENRFKSTGEAKGCSIFKMTESRSSPQSSGPHNLCWQHWNANTDFSRPSTFNDGFQIPRAYTVKLWSVVPSKIKYWESVHFRQWERNFCQQRNRRLGLPNTTAEEKWIGICGTVWCAIFQLAFPPQISTNAPETITGLPVTLKCQVVILSENQEIQNILDAVIFDMKRFPSQHPGEWIHESKL